jgi:hypothetical protein
MDIPLGVQYQNAHENKQLSARFTCTYERYILALRAVCAYQAEARQIIFKNSVRTAKKTRNTSPLQKSTG